MRHSWVKDLVVRRSLSRVEVAVEAAVPPGNVEAPVYRPLLARRSKRLRAALLLLSARLGDAWPEADLERAATGVELLHEATLYHDDVVDLAGQRRGAPSGHQVAGVGAAAFAGTDLLYATPVQFAGLPLPVRRAAARMVTALCWGQIGELENLENLELTFRRRIRIMRDKTARLFAFAARTGGTLSGASDGNLRRMSEFGGRLGLCFQLADDLRDLLSDERDLGREAGADLRDGVLTLPTLYALGSPCPPAARLRNLLLAGVSDPEEVSGCVQAIHDAGGIRRARATLDGWLGAARLVLIGLETAERGPALQSLDSLIDNLRASVPRSDEVSLPIAVPRISRRGRHAGL